MAHWLLKSEPGEYSFDDLLRDRHTTWDGITNNQALLYLRQMKKGDCVFFYHTGAEKRVVGLAQIAGSPCPDPRDNSGKRVVVEVIAKKRLPRAVPLAEIKDDDVFANCPLVRISRLSVVPLDAAMAKRLLKMAGA